MTPIAAVLIAFGVTFAVAGGAYVASWMRRASQRITDLEQDASDRARLDSELDRFAEIVRRASRDDGDELARRRRMRGLVVIPIALGIWAWQRFQRHPIAAASIAGTPAGLIVLILVWPTPGAEPDTMQTMPGPVPVPATIRIEPPTATTTEIITASPDGRPPGGRGMAAGGDTSETTGVGTRPPDPPDRPAPRPPTDTPQPQPTGSEPPRTPDPPTRTPEPTPTDEPTHTTGPRCLLELEILRILGLELLCGFR